MTSFFFRALVSVRDLSTSRSVNSARAAVLRIKRDRVPIGAWLDALDARVPKNVDVVAMANKLTRIAWAVLSTGEDYRPTSNAIAA